MNSKRVAKHTKTIVVRLSTKQKVHLSVLAELNGMTLSEFVRLVLLTKADEFSEGIAVQDRLAAIK